MRTNIFNWLESGLTANQRISLNLYVAYDLDYQNTRPIDYTRISRDLLEHLDSRFYISGATIHDELASLTSSGIIAESEADDVFGKGYAEKRNAILYFAIKHKMDYLVFFDDDEYPIAVTNTRQRAVWSGQQVLSTHMKYIPRADITHGWHCGYISPIPQLSFNEVLSEDVFRTFIEAISNDIVKWDKIKSVMDSGGVTFADPDILVQNEAEEVAEVNHAKFISGANLCLNLTMPERTFPFFNPPGARGEDTFLSTCLSERTVLRVPVYTFHDGFSTYKHLLDGVLPTRLKPVLPIDEAIVTRFYRACIGWARYKPLLLHITDRANYQDRIEDLLLKLDASVPAICEYFDRKEFKNIIVELKKYHAGVESHHQAFIRMKQVWARIIAAREQ